MFLRFLSPFGRLGEDFPVLVEGVVTSGVVSETGSSLPILAVVNVSSKIIESVSGKVMYCYPFDTPGGYRMLLCCDEPFMRGDVVEVLEVEDFNAIVRKVHTRPTRDLPVLCFLITKIPFGEDCNFDIRSVDDKFLILSAVRTEFHGNVNYAVMGLCYGDTIVMGLDAEKGYRFVWHLERSYDVV